MASARRSTLVGASPAATALNGVEIEIVEARELLAMDKSKGSKVNDTSDPFAKAVLLDTPNGSADLPGEVYTTKVWKKTLHPEFHETFQMGTGLAKLTTLSTSSIEVRLYDEDKGMFARNDALGKVTIPLKAIAANKKLELDAWYPLEIFDKMTEVGGPT